MILKKNVSVPSFSIHPFLYEYCFIRHVFLFGTGLLWLDMRIIFHHFAEKKSFERLECSYFFTQAFDWFGAWACENRCHRIHVKASINYVPIFILCLYFIDLYLLSFIFIFLFLPSSSLTYHHWPSLSFTFHHWHSSSFINLHLPSTTIIYLHLSSLNVIVFISVLIYLRLTYFTTHCLIVLYPRPLPLFTFIYPNLP